MTKRQIDFKASKQISARAVNALFKRSEWNDWFSLSDVEFYLKKTLYVVTAWEGRKLAGFASLTGDGRIDVFLDSLVVDYQYQRRGIGTKLMEMVLEKVKKLKPYHFQIQVFDKKVEKFYMKLGFVRNEGTWLMEHKETADKLRAKVKRIRRKTK